MYRYYKNCIRGYDIINVISALKCFVASKYKFYNIKLILPGILCLLVSTVDIIGLQEKHY